MLSDEFNLLLRTLADARLRHEDSRRASPPIRELAETRMELETARDAIYRLRRRRWPELREAEEAAALFWCDVVQAPMSSHWQGGDCDCRGVPTKEPPARSEG